MEAVKQRTKRKVVQKHPVKGLVDELAMQLGQVCEVSAIRDAQLISPNWKSQPMRAWDEVYEDLCREVGSAYGLNDIREA